MTTIVLVSGSLRRESANEAALNTLARALASLDSTLRVESLDIGSLPHFNADEEACGGSAAVRAAKELVARADALAIATPCYNGEMPGVLKNALDWLSRPWADNVLRERPVAVLSASPGARGGVEAQDTLLRVLRKVGALPLERPPLAVAGAAELRTADGEITEAGVVGELEALARDLMAALAPSADLKMAAAG